MPMTEADAPRQDRDSLLAALELFRGIEAPRKYPNRQILVSLRL